MQIGTEILRGNAGRDLHIVKKNCVGGTDTAKRHNRCHYSLLTETGSMVIGEPYYDNDTLQLCVGASVIKDEETSAYLVGSYKYDISSTQSAIE